MADLINETMNKLLDITEAVNNLLSTLMNLEIADKKDSAEYQKNLEYLQMVLEREEEIYQSIPTNLIPQLLSEFTDEDTKNTKELDLYLFDNELFTRIVNKLKEHMPISSHNLDTLLISLTYQKYGTDKDGNDDKNVIGYFNNNMDKLIQDNIHFHTMIRATLYKQFFNTLLKYKLPNLIKYRYQLFNTMPDLNQCVINHKFDQLEPENYDWVYLVTGVNKDLLDKIVNTYLLFLITQLVNIMNSNQEIKQKETITPRMVLLASALIIYSDSVTKDSINKAINAAKEQITEKFNTKQ